MSYTKYGVIVLTTEYVFFKFYVIQETRILR